ncbi:unnamed protein product [Sphenostylis stenocarpa]|uniref:Uncharacterized protein n=1 Tax=Sphenostylis stenocarpa TaxID=92480 RepID=A0AA86RWA3_9FABA|nr:unnamed protein product [Sphenostylis stenocarpa]
MLKYLSFLSLIYTHLKWVLDFIIYSPFCTLHDSEPPINTGAELRRFHHEFIPGSEQDVDSGVGEGEEENRMMRYGPVTSCGAEVLLLHFCSAKKDDRERWWLR